MVSYCFKVNLVTLGQDQKTNSLFFCAGSVIDGVACIYFFFGKSRFCRDDTMEVGGSEVSEDMKKVEMSDQEMVEILRGKVLFESAEEVQERLDAIADRMDELLFYNGLFVELAELLLIEDEEDKVMNGGLIHRC